MKREGRRCIAKPRSASIGRNCGRVMRDRSTTQPDTGPYAGRDAGPVEYAIRRCTGVFLGVGLFSGVINVLALTGSFYMLQIYDRVLPSRSVPTLVGLSLLMAGLYAALGALDFC